MLSRCLQYPRLKRSQGLMCLKSRFHTVVACLAEVVDHYKTLGLKSNASVAAVKKLASYTPSPESLLRIELTYASRQFYTLSKKHHPDHNPNDPKAAERFVQISDAYNVLGHTESRERYDRESQRGLGVGSASAPRGSYSSAAPFGSRPASGLSKRRSQFRGPPPSFYRSGGWGRHSAKRQAQADATASASFNAASSSGEAGRPGGGFGPAGSSSGLDDDVPHFDRPSHLRTQEQQEQRRMKQRPEEAGAEYKTDNASSVLFNFMLISSIVAIGCSLPAWLAFRLAGRKRKDT